MEPLTLYIYKNNGKLKELLKLPNEQVVYMNYFHICNCFLLAKDDYISKMGFSGLLRLIYGFINTRFGDYMEEIDEPLKDSSLDIPFQFKKNNTNQKDFFLNEIKLMNMIIEKILDGPNKADESPSIRFCNLDKILLPEEYRHIAWMENRITPLEIGELLIDSIGNETTTGNSQEIIRDFAEMLIFLFHRQAQLSQGITAVKFDKRTKRTDIVDKKKVVKKGTDKEKTVNTVDTKTNIVHKTLFSRYYTSPLIISLAWAEIIYAIENDLKVKKCIQCGRYANLEGKESLCSDQCKIWRKKEQDNDRYEKKK